MSTRDHDLETDRAVGYRRWILTAASLTACGIASVGLAAAASAAEIVDLQVTPGADSSEIVFELDAPAGYRLERTQTGTQRGPDELLLAIDADATERQLKALSGLVTSVIVYEGGNDPTVVRIRLREPGLIVHDKVLVNPPRLVLNVSRRDGAEIANRPRIPAAPAAIAATPQASPAPGRAGALRDIRVGSHPTFSRLVFELDDPATYRLTRLTQPGGPELLVTLGAASSAQDIRSNSKYISSVQVEKSDTQTVARVRLNGSNLRIKELTLSNPDRIVIDISRK